MIDGRKDYIMSPTRKRLQDRIEQEYPSLSVFIAKGHKKGYTTVSANSDLYFIPNFTYNTEDVTREGESVTANYTDIEQMFKTWEYKYINKLIDKPTQEEINKMNLVKYTEGKEPCKSFILSKVTSSTNITDFFANLGYMIYHEAKDNKQILIKFPDK